MLEIDGELGEGGGQVLRTSLTLSAVLGKPVHIFNIRAKRSKPGLANQHLTCVNALAEITSAKVENAKLGSTELTFEPLAINAKTHSFDIGTAGSISLVAQALLPALLFAKEKSEIEIRGGTHVSHAPNLDYLQNVFLPAISLFGGRINSHIAGYGFYPKGGGSAHFSIEPVANSLLGVDFIAHAASNQENVAKAKIIIQNIPAHVGEREKAEIGKRIAGTDVKIENTRGAGPGNSITIWKGFVGVSALGEIGKSAEKVAGEACEQFEREAPAPLDSHLADQLLIYMALAKGRSGLKTSALTQHALTNIAVIEKFIGKKFETDESENKISIGGIAFGRV